MNGFLQEYGLNIVAVIVILAVIGFATVFGDITTGGVGNIVDDFFERSGVGNKTYTLSWDGNTAGHDGQTFGINFGGHTHWCMSKEVPTFEDLTKVNMKKAMLFLLKRLMEKRLLKRLH